MRIYVFGTRGFPLVQGGVEKHCECLYPLLEPEFQVTVFRRKPYVRSSPGYDNIRFIDLPSTRVKALEATLHSFLATVYSLFQRPDVVHIHNIGPAMFSPLLKLAGIKVVLTYHSPNYEHKKWNRLARIILKLSERIALATSDAIIFISERQRKKYNPKVQAKSCYIPNGIQKPVFTEETGFLQASGLQKHKYILAVGRITPEKGFDYLITAFEKADANGYKLVIAGGVEQEHTYFTELKKRVSSGQIVFTGYVFGNDLAQLYTHAALFVLPSYNEGLPLVLLEAMSYHLDILASDIPANKALNLPVDSYFTTGDVDELSARIQQAVREDAPRRIQYPSMDRYDWSRIAEQTGEVYLCGIISPYLSM